MRTLLLTLLLCSSVALAQPPGGRLVLVIDDLGNQYKAGLQAIASPWVSTVAVMPGRPFSEALAEAAHAQGKEVIVHAPMANGIDFPLGAFGLTAQMNEEELRQTVRQAIATVPHAVGLSNHMGSRLTQNPDAMAWLMAELKQQGLYFFDSRTVASTIAWQVAEENGVPWSMRQIFLDHEPTPEFISRQWRLAMSRVAAGETVTLIGHPYPETLAFLRQATSSSAVETSAMTKLSAVLKAPVIAIAERRNEVAAIHLLEASLQWPQQPVLTP